MMKISPAAEEQEFRGFIPPGFFQDYMAYTDIQESPGSYHFWVAATILSAMLNRQVWVARGMYNIYPNLYTILVAPSGTCRKTRAISMGTDIIETVSSVNIIADKTTPEALLQALQYGSKSMGETPSVSSHTPCSGLILAPELAVFLSSQVYNRDMVSLLTDLYDNRAHFRYHTRNKKAIELNAPCLQLLGGSTPKWLAECMPESAFGGGFMSRIVFVVKQVRDRSRPFVETPDPIIVENLFVRLLGFQARCLGEIFLDQAGLDWYLDWYDTLDPSKVDPNLSGFIERKADILLKLATLISISREETDISQDTLERSEKILSWTQARAFEAFKHIDLTHIGRLRFKIQALLSSQPDKAASRRYLLRKLGSSLNGIAELDQVIDLMQNADELITSCTKNNHGRNTIMYTLTNSGDDE